MAVIEALDDKALLGTVLGKRGGDRRSEKAKADQGGNTTLKLPGRGAVYILARLDRDGHDELAAKVRARI